MKVFKVEESIGPSWFCTRTPKSTLFAISIVLTADVPVKFSRILIMQLEFQWQCTNNGSRVFLAVKESSGRDFSFSQPPVLPYILTDGCRVNYWNVCQAALRTAARTFFGNLFRKQLHYQKTSHRHRNHFHPRFKMRLDWYLAPWQSSQRVDLHVLVY